MTFSEEVIKGIAIDMEDEWEYQNNDTEITCKLYGLEEKAKEMWGDYMEEFPDGWCDIYATIAINGTSEEYVKEIEFVLVTNDPTVEDKYHWESVGYTREGRMIAEQLKQTSNGGLQWMIDEIDEKGELRYDMG